MRSVAFMNTKLGAMGTSFHFSRWAHIKTLSCRHVILALRFVYLIWSSSKEPVESGRGKMLPLRTATRLSVSPLHTTSFTRFNLSICAYGKVLWIIGLLWLRASRIWIETMTVNIRLQKRSYLRTTRHFSTFVLSDRLFNSCYRSRRWLRS